MTPPPAGRAARTPRPDHVSRPGGAWLAVRAVTPPRIPAACRPPPSVGQEKACGLAADGSGDVRTVGCMRSSSSRWCLERDKGGEWIKERMLQNVLNSHHKKYSRQRDSTGGERDVSTASWRVGG